MESNDIEENNREEQAEHQNAETIEEVKEINLSKREAVKTMELELGTMISEQKIQMSKPQQKPEKTIGCNFCLRKFRKFSGLEKHQKQIHQIHQIQQVYYYRKF